MQDEGFLRRLSEALRTSEDPGVESVVEHAREAAVTEATAILEALLTRLILERAVDRLSASGEPSSSDDESTEPQASQADSRASPTSHDESAEPPVAGVESRQPAPTHVSGEVLAPRAEPGDEPSWVWYVYGIERADADPPTDVTGIVGSAVEGVEVDGLRAVVSKVPSADFEQPALAEHFDDLEWVGSNAQAHEAVLGAALARGAVLPLRFGTVFRDHDAVVDVLRRHADDLLSEVDRMSGRREWGAKVVVDLDACDRWIAERSPSFRESTEAPTDRAAQGGRAYLSRRQAQRSRRDERHGLLLEVAGEIHERLSEHAVDAGTSPPQQRELSGYEGEMILNGAYLVDDTATAAFHEAAGKLTERHADKGVVVQITGPWPPHHFISLPPLDDLAEPT